MLIHNKNPTKEYGMWYIMECSKTYVELLKSQNSKEEADKECRRLNDEAIDDGYYDLYYEVMYFETESKMNEYLINNND